MIGELHYLEKVKAAEYKRTENGTEEDIDWKQLKINSNKVGPLECIYIQRTKEQKLLHREKAEAVDVVYAQ